MLDEAYEKFLIKDVLNELYWRFEEEFGFCFQDLECAIGSHDRNKYSQGIFKMKLLDDVSFKTGKSRIV